MSELQTGSPFVIGQSRAEFDAYMEIFGGTPKVDGIFDRKTDTAVHFTILKEDIPPSRIEMPGFPQLDDVNAQKFLSAVSSKRQKNQGSGDNHCPIVHELCALNMFKNRAGRYR